MEVTSKAQRRTPKEIETFRINRLAVLRFYLSSNLYIIILLQNLKDFGRGTKLCPLNPDYTMDLML